MRNRNALLSSRLSSIESLSSLLRDISLAPSDYLKEDDLLDALKTQSKLALYTDTARGIVRMSLNHQKDLASRVLGSFSTLDTLRVAALVAVRTASGQQAGKRRAGSKVDLLERLRIAETSSEMLRCDLIILQRAYDIRCAQALAYAQLAGGKVIDKCRREQKELDASFSLMRIANSATVTNIENARSIRDAKKI